MWSCWCEIVKSKISSSIFDTTHFQGDVISFMLHPFVQHILIQNRTWNYLEYVWFGNWKSVKYTLITGTNWTMINENWLELNWTELNNALNILLAAIWSWRTETDLHWLTDLNWFSYLNALSGIWMLCQLISTLVAGIWKSGCQRGSSMFKCAANSILRTFIAVKVATVPILLL